MKEKCPLCGNDKEPTGMQLLCHPPITEMACRKCQPGKFPYLTFDVKRHDEAALKQSVWDGTGLPPVGVECEYTCCESNHIGKIWHPCVIKYASNYTLVIEEFGITGENIIHPNNVKFRPIRSEIDKKRSEGVIALSRTDPQMVPFEYGDKLSDGSLVGSFWYDLYDTIAAGKIPGVKLSD